MDAAYYSSKLYTHPIIDKYNNKVWDLIILQTMDDTKNNLLKKISGNPKKNSGKFSVPNLKQKFEEDKNANSYELLDDYLTLMYDTDSKFNINNIIKETSKNYGKDYYHNLTDRLDNRLLWKRGSKLGLEIAATNNKTKIHFVLDGLGIDSIISKSGSDTHPSVRPGQGKSITASELRYTYRNWDKLQERVIFYKDNKVVSAPWESEPDKWKRYVPSRGNKQSTSGGRFSLFKKCIS